MTNNLIGFDEIKQNLLNSYQSNKLHHAILLSGIKGIGKATFLKNLAQEILNNFNDNNPDILEIRKDDDKKEITVDKIRKIFNFVTQTSANNNDKFIIIDSACNLNVSAANALLKILEEPRPNNYLFLVTHNPSQLLATIKSRCFSIKVNNLDENDFKKVILKNKNLKDEDVKFLAQITNNSPALAINEGEELIRFYELFLRSLINNKISDNLEKIIMDKNFNFEIFIRCYEFLISRTYKFISQIDFEKFYEEEKIFLFLEQKFTNINFENNINENQNILNKTIRLSLSKKLVFINIFESLIKNYD